MRRAIRKAAQRWLRPLIPGWPDEGRRIVQGPHLEAMLERVAHESKSVRRVFNAGAGEGGYSRLLLKLPRVEYLLESDFGYQVQAPGRFDPRQVFFCASLVSIPLASRSVDLVLCTEVLEHIQEHEKALDEIARVMAPNGTLLITVPTPPAVPDSAHVREGYRPEELSAMLTQRGFKILETRFCMYACFRFMLANWSKWPWSPRIAIWILALLDRFVQIGPPMDLMILAKIVEPGA